MEVPGKAGRALARPEKCHVRKGVEIYLRGRVGTQVVIKICRGNWDVCANLKRKILLVEPDPKNPTGIALFYILSAATLSLSVS